MSIHNCATVHGFAKGAEAMEQSRLKTLAHAGLQAGARSMKSALHRGVHLGM